MMNEERTKGRKSRTVCNNLYSLLIEESAPIGEVS